MTAQEAAAARGHRLNAGSPDGSFTVYRCVNCWAGLIVNESNPSGAGLCLEVDCQDPVVAA